MIVEFVFGLFMIRLWSGSQAIVDCSSVPVGGQSIRMLCWFRFLEKGVNE